MGQRADKHISNFGPLNKTFSVFDYIFLREKWTTTRGMTLLICLTDKNMQAVKIITFSFLFFFHKNKERKENHIFSCDCFLTRQKFVSHLFIQESAPSSTIYFFPSPVPNKTSLLSFLIYIYIYIYIYI